jgi:hypothetical protein
MEGLGTSKSVSNDYNIDSRASKKYTIVASKSYVHPGPEFSTPRKAYLLSGDEVIASAVKQGRALFNSA